MKIFSLIIGFCAIYISSAFVRLELFASVGVIVLGSIGLAFLLKIILNHEHHKIFKLIFTSIILGLFLIPIVLPENNSWHTWTDFPPSILNGGTNYSSFSSNDWLDAMTWLKQNTSEDAVIASWWDYGYWISTLSQRTTLADNATLIDWQIKKIAYSLITTPENSWHIFNSHFTEDISPYLGDENILLWGGELESEFITNYKKNNNGKDCKIIIPSESQKLGVPVEYCHPVTKGMNADYILIYVAGERFLIDSSPIPLYTLEGGGDESKKTWFVKISNHEVSKYVQSDNMTPTHEFMEKSTLGQLIPFSIFKYVEPNTGRTFDEFRDGFIPVYINDIKFNDLENDPYFLVYASPSFYDSQPGIMSAVLIYKVNSNYQS